VISVIYQDGEHCGVSEKTPESKPHPDKPLLFLLSGF